MKRVFKILLFIFIWGAVITYVAVSMNYTSRQSESSICRGIRAVVTDSADLGFITSGMIKGWFTMNNGRLTNEPLNKINTHDIKKNILNRGFVKSAKVYTTVDGFLNIEVSQRVPIMKFYTSDGRRFYITEDEYILPLQGYHTRYVPVITGDMPLPFGRGFVGSLDKIMSDNEKKMSKNSLFLSKLINFVKFVSGDDFWSSQIVQINLVAKGDEVDPYVELVPRVGDHVIMLGSLDGFDKKLAKMMSFYRNGVEYEGWQKYGYINLEYENQIVCTK